MIRPNSDEGRPIIAQVRREKEAKTIHRKISDDDLLRECRPADLFRVYFPTASSRGAIAVRGGPRRIRKISGNVRLDGAIHRFIYGNIPIYPSYHRLVREEKG